MDKLLTFLLYFPLAFVITACIAWVVKFLFSRLQKEESTDKYYLDKKFSYRLTQMGIRIIFILIAFYMYRDNTYALIGIAAGTLLSSKIQMIRLFRSLAKES